MELDFPKVFPNNGIVFGVSGSLSDLQKIKYAKLPSIEDWDTDRFVQKGLKRVRKILGGESSALCSINGRVYELDGWTWVRNTNGIYAVGSGARLAIGAMMAGASVAEALEIAAARDPYTGGKLHVAVEEEILDE